MTGDPPDLDGVAWETGVTGVRPADGRLPDQVESLLQDVPIDRLPKQTFLIADLVCADTVRLAGQDQEHVRLLAEVEWELPPILVHRPTRRVIDGAHRISAAKLRGDRDIEAHVFDGDEATAFVLAVRANTEHGLPLTLGDRVAAATRILQLYPMWSDRAVARATGLAASTVGRIRKRSIARSEQPIVRLSRDGRVRPLNAAEGRMVAGRLMTEAPDTPLREIARRAGISPATAKDVRRRLAEGRDPVPLKQRRAIVPAQDRVRPRAELRSGQPPRPTGALLDRLRRDPSLRFSDAGREVLKRLGEITSRLDELPRTMNQLPPHSTVLVTELFSSLARNCELIADDLRRRSVADAR
ncbi:ParB/RepB/Spo0J family partition protein [Actinomadura sp. KC216]|uniref:ParB/RepB/Spo0J family partition protein n=1 Tax=Actinomadura sp. KC216 TaxID=2530370 RepID=UPI0014043CAF|nr:ParB/RepB/Spo0J family partition protein [Actinomadura sp. KC216]